MGNIFSSMKNVIKSCLSGITQIPSWFKQQLFCLFNDIKNIRYSLKNLASSNMDLGIYHMQNGNFRDAIFRFKLVKRFFEPGNKIVRYRLGWVYFLKQDHKNAVIQLAKAEQEDEVNLLAFIKSIDSAQYIPSNIYSLYRDLTAQLFIDKFNSNVVNIPKNLVLELNTNITDLPENYDILELGSNVGLLGNELQKRMQEQCSITAVETSSRMLELQNLYFPDRQLYDAIIHNPIGEFLENNSKQYDIITSLDGLTFAKNLQETFANIFATLKPKGYFACVIGSSTATQLANSCSEFTYNSQKISVLLHDIGFNILSFKEINLEIKNNYAIFICRKT